MNFDFPDGIAQQWAVVTCLASAAMLCVALHLEFVLGYPPCPLCMMQRIWFVLVAAFAYIGLFHNPRWGIYPLFSIAAAIGGGYYASKHLWLQSLPADQVPACGPELAYMLDAFPLSDLLVALTSGTGDCAQVSWTLLGISIPGWSLAGFVLLIGTSILQLRHGSH